MCAADGYSGDCEDDVLLRNHGKNLPGVSRGGHGESGDRSAVGDREEHPSIKERDQIAVSFAEVNVLTAGFRKHRAEFGEGDAAKKRDDATKYPNSKKESGMR